MSNDKTLCVTVTIEATTDWEPNYFEDNDWDKPADSTFKPKDLTFITRGYMEVVNGREKVAVNALTDALVAAGLDSDGSGQFFTEEASA